MKTISICAARPEEPPISMSSLVLGTCYFSTGISRDESFALMDRCFELGGRTLDTARVYADWLENGESASERTVGAWLRERGVRREITLVTKGGHPHAGKSRLRRADLREDMARSVDCLGCAPDVYFLHRDDTSIPVGEIVDVLDELVREGMTRAVGASNWSLGRILEANEYAERNGRSPFTVSQIQWSLAAATPESWGDPTLVCMTREEYAGYLRRGIPVMAFSPQAKGFFSKFIAGGPDAINSKIRQRFVTPENLARAERLREFCARRGISPAAGALAYLTCNALPAAAILGCSNVAQLEDSMTAADLQIGAREAAALAGE